MITEDLIKKAQKGDGEAFTRIYNETVKTAYYVAKRILVDDAATEDILQESYIAVFEHLGEYKSGNFQGWVDTIVANRAKNYLRKKNPILFSQMENEDNQVMEFEEEKIEFRPEESVDYSETKRLVMEIVDGLSAEQRLAIILFYFEQKSVKEIASICECTENTIKSRLNYGRAKIKEEVLLLEKKGTKLYSVSVIPFLYWILQQEASTVSVPTSTRVATFSAVKNTMASVGTEIVKKAGMAIGTKIAIGVTSAVLVIGGGTAVVALNGGFGVINDGAGTEEENTESKTEKIAREAEIPEESIIEYGVSGQVNWVYTLEKDLIIYGEGAMADYEYFSMAGGEDRQHEKFSQLGYLEVDKLIIKEGVTRIGAYSFMYLNAGNTEATCVEMADSVVEIGDGAFANACVHEIQLSQNIDTIPYYCFKQTKILGDFVLPKQVSKIEEYAFCYTSFNSIILPEKLTYIEPWAFNYCHMNKIVIPESVTTIPENCFSGCEELVSIQLPNSLETIEGAAFSSCTALTELVIPENVKHVSDSILSGSGVNSLYIYSEHLSYDDLESNGTAIPNLMGRNFENMTVYCKQGLYEEIQSREAGEKAYNTPYKDMFHYELIQ